MKGVPESEIQTRVARRPIGEIVFDICHSAVNVIKEYASDFETEIVSGCYDKLVAITQDKLDLFTESFSIKIDSFYPLIEEYEKEPNKENYKNVMSFFSGLPEVLKAKIDLVEIETIIPHAEELTAMSTNERRQACEVVVENCKPYLTDLADLIAKNLAFVVLTCFVVTLIVAKKTGTYISNTKDIPQSLQESYENIISRLPMSTIESLARNELHLSQTTLCRLACRVSSILQLLCALQLEIKEYTRELRFMRNVHIAIAVASSLVAAYFNYWNRSDSSQRTVVCATAIAAGTVVINSVCIYKLHEICSDFEVLASSVAKSIKETKKADKFLNILVNELDSEAEE